MINKKYHIMVEHLHSVLSKNFGIIFLLGVFNYICFGFSRYIFGKYMDASLVTKILKISYGFINIFLFFILLFLILSFLNRKISKGIIWIFYVTSLIFFIIDVFCYINLDL